MKIIKCDIDKCNEDAYKEDIDVCDGYRYSSEYGGDRTEYKPFEKPSVTKKDLCEKHFKKWCKVTYEAFWGKVKK